MYGIFVEGGHADSVANEVSERLWKRGLIYPRIRVLSLLSRLVWVHVQHAGTIQRDRQRADADKELTGRSRSSANWS